MTQEARLARLEATALESEGDGDGGGVRVVEDADFYGSAHRLPMDLQAPAHECESWYGSGFCLQCAAWAAEHAEEAPAGVPGKVT